MRSNALMTIRSLAVGLVAALPAPAKPGVAAPASKIGGPTPAVKGGTTPSSERTKPTKPVSGTCKNLCIVHYKPIGVGRLRHWAHFLTDSATADSTSGTIYQVLADSKHPSGLAPYKLENKKVSQAGSYGGATWLGNIEASKVEAYYNNYKDFLYDGIGDPDTNALDQSNFQHRTTDLGWEIERCFRKRPER